jgi:formyl-CoA transferase
MTDTSPAVPDAPGAALAGIKVLDIATLFAGPLAATLLADFGADVTKIEHPKGDPVRSHGASKDGVGLWWKMLSRNKKAITLYLGSPEGQDIFRRMVADADVVIENFRPGTLERWGLGYDTLSEINPRLVLARITGFGQTGPYAQRPGYDLIAQGASGVMSVTGEPDGNPVKCGVPVSDLSAGLFCAVGILAALAARERTGEGQQIDTSLWEGALALSIWETAELWSTGNTPGPMGSAHRLTAPYQALRTRDGHLTVGGNNQKLWARLCEVIGRPELTEDPRFATNADRMANRPELAAELEKALTQDDTEAWVERLLEAGVPAGPIHDYAQVVADPHTKSREMVVEMEHPEAGTVYGLGIPIKLSATPGSIRRPAPLLGEHNDEIRAELG